MQLVKLSIIGFIAGFLAVLIFHQSLWYLLNLVRAYPSLPLGLAARSDPAIRRALGNFKSLLGGAWGALLPPLLQGLTGRAYWAGWIIIGAVALSLVAFFVVPPIKGEPIPRSGRVSSRPFSSTPRGASAPPCS